MMLRGLLFAAAGVFALLGAVPLVQAGAAPPRPVVVDTDLSPDDWMALLFLLKRADVDVKAITVGGVGTAHCATGIKNAMRLTALAGKPDVPVACGTKNPAVPSWSPASESMLGLKLPDNSNKPTKPTALKLLQQTIDSSATPVTIVALAPLTNIAELVGADTKLSSHVDRIYIMGGALDAGGNLAGIIKTKNTTAEWNIYTDPAAASTVLQSKLPITMVGLDATQHAPITVAFYDQLGKSDTAPAAKFVHDVMSKQMDFVKSGYWFFWDPLDAAVAADNSLVTVQPETVKVITAKGNETGRIVRDKDGGAVSLAENPNTALFEQEFIAALNAGG